MSTAEQAINWFSRWREGDLSASERQAFTDWLTESPLHVREYLETSKVWGALQSPTVWPSASRDECLQIIRQTVQGSRIAPLNESSNSPLPVRGGSAGRRGYRRMRFAIAASVSILAVAFAFYLSARPPTYTTTRGEQRYVVLPDGSTIQLNTLTKLSVQFDAHTRSISLAQGEALFRVAKDPSRPFEVKTPYARVLALGTSFNVYNRPEGTTVTVLDGKVRMASTVQIDPSRPLPFIDLAPRQTAEVTTQGAVIPLKPKQTYKPDQQTEIAWTRRRIVLDGDLVDKAVAEFNRYNVKQIRIDDPALKDLRITGVFNADEPTALIKYLREIRSLQVTETDTQLTVHP